MSVVVSANIHALESEYDFPCTGKGVQGYWHHTALTLSVGRQEGHAACKKTGCWFVGGDDLTGALYDL